LIVKQGIVYFFGAFLVYLHNFLDPTTRTEAGLIVVYILAFVPTFVLTPRFIISIRELYAHDSRGRRGEGTGFGLSTLSGRGSPGTAIVFAEVEQNETLEDVQEIAMEDQTNY